MPPEAVSEHLDPEWWLRCAEIDPTTRILATDLCTFCGHVRGLHTLNGCTALSTSLVNAPYPCDCTNKSNGSIFRDAATLRQATRSA